MGPLVSVLIPTCNRPTLLLKAINSALLQSYKNIEVVVSDNSSSAETEKMVSQILDTRLVYSKNEKNIGPILNWRKALEIANGKYCVVLPDDDYLLNPFYLEDAVTIAEQHAVQLVVVDCILARPHKRLVGASGHSGLIDGQVFIERFLKNLSIPTIANLFDRKSAMELDAFQTNDILYSDVELWMKLMSRGSIFCYDIPSVCYLFHSDNIVTNMSPDALVCNSKYIRRSVVSFASDELIYRLVCRYVLFVDGIYKLADYAFIQNVFRENGINSSPIALLLKCKYARTRAHLKAVLKHCVK